MARDLSCYTAKALQGQWAQLAVSSRAGRARGEPRQGGMLRLWDTLPWVGSKLHWPALPGTHAPPPVPTRLTRPSLRGSARCGRCSIRWLLSARTTGCWPSPGVRAPLAAGGAPGRLASGAACVQAGVLQQSPQAPLAAPHAQPSPSPPTHPPTPPLCILLLRRAGPGGAGAEGEPRRPGCAGGLPGAAALARARDAAVLAGAGGRGPGCGLAQAPGAGGADLWQAPA